MKPFKIYFDAVLSSNYPHRRLNAHQISGAHKKQSPYVLTVRIVQSPIRRSIIQNRGHPAKFMASIRRRLPDHVPFIWRFRVPHFRFSSPLPPRTPYLMRSFTYTLRLIPYLPHYRRIKDRLLRLSIGHRVRSLFFYYYLSFIAPGNLARVPEKHYVSRVLIFAGWNGV